MRDKDIFKLQLSTDEVKLLVNILAQISPDHVSKIEENESINKKWVREGDYLVNSENGRKIHYMTKEVIKSDEYYRFLDSMKSMSGYIERSKFLNFLMDYEILIDSEITCLAKYFGLRYNKKLNDFIPKDAVVTSF